MLSRLFKPAELPAQLPHLVWVINSNNSVPPTLLEALSSKLATMNYELSPPIDNENYALKPYLNTTQALITYCDFDRILETQKKLQKQFNNLEFLTARFVFIYLCPTNNYPPQNTYPLGLRVLSANDSSNNIVRTVVAWIEEKAHSSANLSKKPKLAC